MSKGLNAARFAAFYSRRFGSDNTPGGDERQVTSWECATRNVRTAKATMQERYCAQTDAKARARPGNAVIGSVLSARTRDGARASLRVRGSACACDRGALNP